VNSVVVGRCTCCRQHCTHVCTQTTPCPCTETTQPCHAWIQHACAMHGDNTTLPCMEATRLRMTTPHLCMLAAADGSIMTCVLLRKAGSHWKLLSDSCSCSSSTEELFQTAAVEEPYTHPMQRFHSVLSLTCCHPGEHSLQKGKDKKGVCLSLISTGVS